MLLTGLSLRDFRGYERAAAPLGSGLTVITGPNGSGKTNLLEALYFGCTGRSCRTHNDRELVRFGTEGTRVVVSAVASDGAHELSVAFRPGEPKRMAVDGAPVEGLLDAPQRPLVSVFLPDRLDLIKGAPGGRRAHLDAVVTALWPIRSTHRRAYAQTLAQRNALITRIRGGAISAASLDAWDEALARDGLALMADRRAATELIAPAFIEVAAVLGLDGEPELRYLPRSKAATLEAFLEELGQRRAGDLGRGFSAHGPHRDDLVLSRAGRELRTYGSQGQQRSGLLALLLAERQVLAQRRGEPPVMLLDDVVSELDETRRDALGALLTQQPGQVMITATDLDHVPGGDLPATVRIRVQAGAVTVDPAGSGPPGQLGSQRTAEDHGVTAGACGTPG